MTLDGGGILTKRAWNSQREFVLVQELATVLQCFAGALSNKGLLIASFIVGGG